MSRQIIGADVEFDLNGIVVIVPETQLPVLVDDATVGFKGFGVGWDVIKNGRSIEMSRSEFEPEHGDQTQKLSWQKAEWTTSQFPAWVSGSDYAKDEFVKDDGVVYKVIAAVTNSTTAPASDATHFALAPHSYDYWFTGQLDRPLDMPIEPYNGVATGMSDRPFVTDVFASDLSYTRVKFRLGSPVDPALHDFIHKDDTTPYLMARPYIRLHVSGRRADPPKTAPFACEDPTSQNWNLALIAKSYLNARENGRCFAYGANWPYRGSDAVNDSCGRALVECDTIALMALIGMDYDNSPYEYDTASLTADFDTVMAAWNMAAWSSTLPWLTETEELVKPIDSVWTNGLGGRIVDQGAMTWWFWDNGYVFRPEREDENGKTYLDLSQLRSGDLVMFRRAKSTFFDNVGHIGIIDVGEDGTVYVIHATLGDWTDGDVVVRSRLVDEFFAIAPGRYRPEDMYFARIPYGSTGEVEGSYIPPEEDEEDEETEE